MGIKAVNESIVVVLLMSMSFEFHVLHSLKLESEWSIMKMRLVHRLCASEERGIGVERGRKGDPEGWWNRVHPCSIQQHPRRIKKPCAEYGVTTVQYILPRSRF